ncbi:MAG: hypothetical protein ACPLPS_10035, partial [bacterium]
MFYEFINGFIIINTRLHWFILLLTIGFLISAFGQKEQGFFGIATGAETLGYYNQLFPLLKEAGVKWVRIFPEWAHIQPRENEWNFSLS